MRPIPETIQSTFANTLAQNIAHDDKALGVEATRLSQDAVQQEQAFANVSSMFKSEALPARFKKDAAAFTSAWDSLGKVRLLTLPI